MPDGPFLWFREGGSPWGFDRAPRGGFCVNAFVFLERDGRVLLGRYRPHEAWPRLAGLDEARVRRFASGWTVPASHVKLGEHPRDAARRIVEDILRLSPVALSEPRVLTEFDEHPGLPDVGPHHDLSFHFTATLPRDARLTAPPWFDALELHDLRALPVAAYAREHGDVAARHLSS